MYDNALNLLRSMSEQNLTASAMMKLISAENERIAETGTFEERAHLTSLYFNLGGLHWNNKHNASGMLQDSIEAVYELIEDAVVAKYDLAWNGNELQDKQGVTVAKYVKMATCFAIKAICADGSELCGKPTHTIPTAKRLALRLWQSVRAMDQGIVEPDTEALIPHIQKAISDNKMGMLTHLVVKRLDEMGVDASNCCVHDAMQVMAYRKLGKWDGLRFELITNPEQQILTALTGVERLTKGDIQLMTGLNDHEFNHEIGLLLDADKVISVAYHVYRLPDATVSIPYTCQVTVGGEGGGYAWVAETDEHKVYGNSEAEAVKELRLGIELDYGLKYKFELVKVDTLNE